MDPGERLAALECARRGDAQALGKLLESFRPYVRVIVHGLRDPLEPEMPHRHERAALRRRRRLRRVLPELRLGLLQPGLPPGYEVL